MKVTMQTIADKLGISKNTVSQALRNKSTVSPQTKEAVNQMAAHLGYQYQKEIIQTDERSGKKFAIIATEYTLSLNSFFGVVLNQIKDLVFKHKQTLDIFIISRNEENSVQLPDKLCNDTYDGLFILSFFSNKYLKALYGLNNIPKILVDHHQPGLDIDSVLTANIDGSYEAISYLADKSIKTIGFIGEIDRSPSYTERLIGFNLAIQKLGLETNETWIIKNLQENQNHLFNAIEGITRQPDAWFCVNNGYAFSLMNYFQIHGMNVPDDVKVLAFDDTDISRMTHPRMTVMATDLREMGQTAYDLLQYRMNNIDSPIRQVSLKPHLIIGGTV